MAATPSAPNFTIHAARYAARKMLVRVIGDGSGMNTRADRLCQALKGRWTNRERGYVMSPRAVARLMKLHAEGRDAVLKFDSVHSSHYELEG